MAFPALTSLLGKKILFSNHLGKDVYTLTRAWLLHDVYYVTYGRKLKRPAVTQVSWPAVPQRWRRLASHGGQSCGPW